MQLGDITRNRVRVDRSNIAENARRIEKHSGKKIIAVVKNNAYNMGLERVVDTLTQSGVMHFAVTMSDEALFIRERFPNAYVLQFNPACREEIETAKKHRIALSIAGKEWFLENADFLNDVELHLKINVGMNRFGIGSIEDASEIVTSCRERKLRLTGLCTHFPCAEDDEPTGHEEQVRFFEKVYRALSAMHGFTYVHSENTAAILRADERLRFCNFVRPGIMVYGYSSLQPVDWLLPSLYLSTSVIDIHDVQKGGHLGYGTGYAAPRETRVAVLPIGYGDGLLRVRKEAPVWINGRTYPIISKIFMSHTFVEIDERVSIGDEVEIYGDHIRVDTLSSGGWVTNTEQLAALHICPHPE